MFIRKRGSNIFKSQTFRRKKMIESTIHEIAYNFNKSVNHYNRRTFKVLPFVRTSMMLWKIYKCVCIFLALSSIYCLLAHRMEIIMKISLFRLAKFTNIGYVDGVVLLWHQNHTPIISRTKHANGYYVFRSDLMENFLHHKRRNMCKYLFVCLWERDR